MIKRFALFCLASLLAAPAPAYAQGKKDPKINYIQGRWRIEKGGVIKFDFKRDNAKFYHTAGPSDTYVGSYRAGEGGADIVLEYPFGLKCYYNVDTGSGSDQKEIYFDLRNATPQADARTCISGTLKRLADTE